MLTIIMNRELHSTTYFLMFNLALSDILVSGFVETTTIFGKHFLMEFYIYTGFLFFMFQF